jgi:hypothetical protein
MAILCYMQPAAVRCDAGQSLLAAIRSGDRAAVVAAVGALVRQLDKEGFDAFAAAGGLQQLVGELRSADVACKVNTVKALRALVKYGMAPFVERSGLVDGLVACTGERLKLRVLHPMLKILVLKHALAPMLHQFSPVGCVHARSICHGESRARALLRSGSTAGKVGTRANTAPRPR